MWYLVQTKYFKNNFQFKCDTSQFYVNIIISWNSDMKTLKILMGIADNNESTHGGDDDVSYFSG